MQTGKVSRLPRPVRDDLNRRLEDSEKTKSVLAWINSLPDVQAILAKEFNGEPVKQQNLDSWRKSGFRNWQLRQTALQFTADSADDEDLDQSTLEKMSA